MPLQTSSSPSVVMARGVDDGEGGTGDAICVFVATPVPSRGAQCKKSS